MALRSGGLDIPKSSCILFNIWDLNVSEHGKAQPHNFPPLSFLQTEQNEAKNVDNSTSISAWVVVQSGIWQTGGDSVDILNM